MSIDPEFADLVRAEHAAEASRLAANQQEAARYAGVAWSGLAPDLAPHRQPVALARRAAARLTALRDWRSSARGRLTAAMAEAERAVEEVRASVARGLALDDRRCLAAIDRLAHATRTAMDATASSGLSEAPCATSIASSNRSIASPTSSQG